MSLQRPSKDALISMQISALRRKKLASYLRERTSVYHVEILFCHAVSQPLLLISTVKIAQGADNQDVVIVNDATNSCAFLSVLLADVLIKKGEDLPTSIDEWE